MCMRSGSPGTKKGIQSLFKPSYGLYLLTLSVTQREKQQVPWKTIRGILYFWAVHGMFRSDMIASGWCWRTRSSLCGWSIITARLKLFDMSLDGRESRFSQLWGRLTVSEGNLRMRRSISTLKHCLSRSMMDWKRERLHGVVTMVVFIPRLAKSLAMSSMGIWWPGDMKGKKNTWSCCWSLDAVFSAMEIRHGGILDQVKIDCGLFGLLVKRFYNTTKFWVTKRKKNSWELPLPWDL